MSTPIENLLKGFLAPLNGLVLLFSSVKRISYAIIPFIIAFFVIVGGVVWAYGSLGGIVEGWLASFEWLTGWFFSATSFFVLVLGWVGVLTFGFLVAYVLISILAGPFYSLMVEDVFRTDSPEGVRSNTLKTIINMFLAALIKGVLFLLIGLICFFLMFVPILNIVASVIPLLIIAFDCMDYSFEVDLMPLRQRFRFFFDNSSVFAGFALAIFMTSFVPGSFFILLPAFVCGASGLYIEMAHK